MEESNYNQKFSFDKWFDYIVVFTIVNDSSYYYVKLPLQAISQEYAIHYFEFMTRERIKQECKVVCTFKIKLK